MNAQRPHQRVPRVPARSPQHDHAHAAGLRAQAQTRACGHVPYDYGAKGSLARFPLGAPVVHRLLLGVGWGHSMEKREDLIPALLCEMHDLHSGKKLRFLTCKLLGSEYPPVSKSSKFF